MIHLILAWTSGLLMGLGSGMLLMVRIVKRGVAQAVARHQQITATTVRSAPREGTEPSRIIDPSWRRGHMGNHQNEEDDATI